MEELERHVGDQLAAKGAAVQLDADRVGDDNTHGLRGCLAFLHQGGRSQVDVIVLQVSVQGDAAAVLVVAAQGQQIEHLGESGARGDGASLAGLQLGDVLGELGVHHGHLAMLDNVDLAMTEDIKNMQIF